MKHLLSIEDLTIKQIGEILALTKKLKAQRGKRSHPQPLKGQTWALIFAKYSTRTRVSFEVGIRELGGRCMFLSNNDIQLGRGEPIVDTARVLGRMIHGCIIRTYHQKDVVDFAATSGIPTINALTDDEHPCQILADIFTIEEKLGPIKKKVICFIGDGACNVPASWMLAAGKLGFELRIAAPRKYQPSPDLLKRAGGKIIVTDDRAKASDGADVIYSDTWISMGKEEEEAQRLAELDGYQINDQLLAHAKPKVLVMHCLPAYRGKEITDDVFERHAETIFDQAENRLHTQKAIMALLAKGWKR
ncbi:MAG: ornithine carbamoyltransferase [Verrucomicrobia bacterium]|nr:ornithine carbamoyltransferase [Verrucomicrobiota bacterium]